MTSSLIGKQAVVVGAGSRDIAHTTKPRSRRNFIPKRRSRPVPRPVR